MILLIFFFFGVMGLNKMPVDLFPNVSHPQLSIVTKYENASPDEIEKEISKVLEEELSFLKNLTYIRSISQEGESRLELSFHWGTHMDFAALQVREKIDIVKDKLPEDADDPIVERYNPNAQPILMINVTGASSGHQPMVASSHPSMPGSDIELRRIADTQLKSTFERVMGVAQVKVFGGQESEIEVSLNPHQLKAFRLTVQDVINALKASNITSRGGFVREGRIDLLIKVQSELKSIDDVLNTIVSVVQQKPIYLKNIGNSKEKPKLRRDYAFLNGKQTVALAIYKESSGNALKISQNFTETLPNLAKATHSTLNITYDQSNYIKNSISLIKGNAIQGAILTILVLLLFLRSFAPTLVILISIPFSVVASFFLLYLNGVTLNIFSMAGIALALGMVVDSSIVILENIFEHLRQETKPKHAAVHATLEVSGAVIASTLTTLAVFVPILFVKGPLGIIFKDLSLSIIYSLSFALLIAFTLVPMLAGQFLTQSPLEKIGVRIDRWKKWVVRGLSILDNVFSLGSKIIRLFERGLNRFKLTPESAYQKAVLQTQRGEQTIGQIQTKVEATYEMGLKEAIQSWKSRISVISVVFVIFIISIWFLPRSEFLPESLQTYYTVQIHYPLGTSLEYTQEKALVIEKHIREFPHIVMTDLKVSAGKIALTLEFQKAKYAKKNLKKLRTYLTKIPDTYFSIASLSPLSNIAEGLESKSLDLKIKGPNMKVLETEGAKFANMLKKTNGIESATLLYEGTKPELEIIIDRERAMDLGLTPKSIATQIKNQLYGIKATTLHAEGRDLAVMVRGSDRLIETQSHISDLLIPTPLHTFIPLHSVGSLKEVYSPSQIDREEKEKTLTVLANLNASESPEVVLKNIPKSRLPQGYSLQTGPQIKLYQMSFLSLKAALIISIILIYMIMAAQFESLVHPFTILFSVPLSMIGVTAALILFGKLLSISAYIGIIILAGISVNNAIILIDYINILRRRGVDREEAIMIAGKRRLRPILMTSITTIIGMVPMALGIGAGTELYQPLAIVMIGGMASSTLLTLLFIPTIYCFFDDLSDILGIGLLKLQLGIQKKFNE